MDFIKLHGIGARCLPENCAISHFDYVANIQFGRATRIILQFESFVNQTICNRSQGQSLRFQLLGQ